jgi:hypothetical protein
MPIRDQFGDNLPREIIMRVSVKLIALVVFNAASRATIGKIVPFLLRELLQQHRLKVLVRLLVVPIVVVHRLT